MEISIALTLLVAVAGLLAFALTNGKASQAGLYAWGVGLLAFLLRMGDNVIRF